MLLFTTSRRRRRLRRIIIVIILLPIIRVLHPRALKPAPETVNVRISPASGITGSSRAAVAIIIVSITADVPVWRGSRRGRRFPSAAAAAAVAGGTVSVAGARTAAITLAILAARGAVRSGAGRAWGRGAASPVVWVEGVVADEDVVFVEGAVPVVAVEIVGVQLEAGGWADVEAANGTVDSCHGDVLG
jgi:hypothetical protein